MIEICNANGRKTGAALRLYSRGDELVLAIASQRPDSAAPEFDWDDAIRVRIPFCGICDLLWVLRGCSDGLCDGKGLLFRDGEGTKCIMLWHENAYLSGYMIEVSLCAAIKSRVVKMFLSSPRAMGICSAIDAHMGRFL